MRLFRLAHRGADPHLATYNGSVGWGRRYGAGEPVVQASFDAAGDHGHRFGLVGTAEEAERLIRDLVAAAASLHAGDHPGADAAMRRAQARETYVRALLTRAEAETRAAEADYARWFGHLRPATEGPAKPSEENPPAS